MIFLLVCQFEKLLPLCFLFGFWDSSNLLLYNECFDIYKPPIALLIFNEITYKLKEIYSPLKPHVSHNFIQKGKSLVKILSCSWTNNSRFFRWNVAMRVCDEKSFILRNFFIKIRDFIRNQKAMWVAILREYSSANKSMVSMAFYIFLDTNYLIPQLLQGNIMQVTRVN